MSKISRILTDLKISDLIYSYLFILKFLAFILNCKFAKSYLMAKNLYLQLSFWLFGLGKEADFPISEPYGMSIMVSPEDCLFLASGLRE